jgi:hypothetical protein
MRQFTLSLYGFFCENVAFISMLSLDFAYAG